jgi:hypothetical protein
LETSFVPWLSTWVPPIVVEVVDSLSLLLSLLPPQAAAAKRRNSAAIATTPWIRLIADLTHEVGRAVFPFAPTVSSASSGTSTRT